LFGKHGINAGCGPVTALAVFIWRLVRSYIRLWAIEETIRLIKQSYDIDDVRVLAYRGLRNLMTLVLAASYFAAVVRDTGAKLKVMAGHVLKAAKRVLRDSRLSLLCDSRRPYEHLHTVSRQNLPNPAEMRRTGNAFPLR
jgi:hypothetical protein